MTAHIRVPDFDICGAAWQDTTTGLVRYALPGYDLNSAEAAFADALMSLPPEQRAAQLALPPEQRIPALRVPLEQRAALLRNADAPPTTPQQPCTAHADDYDDYDDYGDAEERVIEQTALGDGLTRTKRAYVYADGFSFLVDTWALGDASIEIELGSNVPEMVALDINDFNDVSWRPSRLLLLAKLLSRPDVQEALADAAVREAVQDTKQAHRKGGA